MLRKSVFHENLLISAIEKYQKYRHENVACLVLTFKQQCARNLHQKLAQNTEHTI